MPKIFHYMLQAAMTIGLLALHPYALADGWTGQFSILGVQVSAQNSDGSRIYVAPSPSLNTTCTSGGGAQLRLDGSTQRGKYAFAVINLAMVTGKKVTAALVGCDDWGFPIITDLQIFNN